MMMTNGQEEGKWSDKKMEGDESMRTVECLRGRLLAERQASRTAKEDSERMSKKLEELENLLKDEIKQRNKAEKKLKFLKKKLESLKPSSSASEQSSSCISFSTTLNPNDPEAHESKCHFTSSIASQESSYNVSDTATSNKQNQESPSSKHSSPEEICQNPPHKSQDESKCHFTSSIASQESSYNVSDTATSNKQNHESPSSKHSSHEEFCHNPPHKSQDESKCQFTNSIASQESSYNDSDTAASNKQNHESPTSKHSSSEEFCLNPPHKSQDSKPDDNSSSDSKSSVAENENYDDEENVDDSLAMVPFSLPLSSQTTPEVKPVTVPVHQSVREVLETLRHVRENIQSTMERRRMIRVGPV